MELTRDVTCALLQLKKDICAVPGRCNILIWAKLGTETINTLTKLKIHVIIENLIIL